MDCGHPLPLSSVDHNREREMKRWVISLLSLLLALSFGALGLGQTTREVSRDDFPPDFVFGAGTSAYQVEGAAAEDGRTPSIWDTYTHAGKLPNNATGDVAADGYHKYKEDVKLMSDTGLEAYKFSISWSRLIPNGRGAINLKGLAYYNNLINELVKHGIQPHITLYHLDLPQILEDEYGGWLSPKIVDDFTEYANVCFREFGDRVSFWTTIVEPNAIGQACYDYGLWPPNRCSDPFGIDCTEGDSTTEPYIVVHNLLRAHASVVALYRTKYQGLQGGWIGLNVYGLGCSPLTNSTADVEATERALDFYIGWILHPLVFGDYPEIMKKNAGLRLPPFTKRESELIKGSFDFIGLNYYTSVYVGDTSNSQKLEIRDYTADMFAIFTVSKNATPTGKYVPSYVPINPLGLLKFLEYLKQDYGNPPIYIQENGYGLGTNNTIKDTKRIEFLSGYIGSTLDAIKNGSDVRGYFVWSFMDVLEFLGGYTTRCGLYYVDFEDKERRRLPKQSAHWYAKFLKKSDKELSMKNADLDGTLHFQE